MTLLDDCDVAAISAGYDADPGRSMSLHADAYLEQKWLDVEQEAVFGRTKREGAPLSGGGEFDAPAFGMAGATGPLIPTESHMALAHPSTNDGQRILRRAYNYTDGSDHLGRLDAGLFFLAYNRDLERQFIPIQARLSGSDLMNEYVRYIGNATFAIPPGVQPGGYLGQGLFEG